MTWHVVIGANLVRALLRAGDRGVVLDDLSLGRRERLAGLPGSIGSFVFRAVRVLLKEPSHAAPQTACHPG